MAKKYGVQQESTHLLLHFDLAAGESVEPAAFAGVLRVNIGMHEGEMIGEGIMNHNLPPNDTLHRFPPILFCALEVGLLRFLIRIHGEVQNIPFLELENHSMKEARCSEMSVFVGTTEVREATTTSWAAARNSSKRKQTSEHAILVSWRFGAI
ncbi:hypothetical protein BDZ89DRAFT_433969 [Hymenopellis radicata]|nr:hypothetical protein BDZ89DRAFT_433969 [Hymenopellis radicata]